MDAYSYLKPKPSRSNLQRKISRMSFFKRVLCKGINKNIKSSGKNNVTIKLGYLTLFLSFKTSLLLCDPSDKVIFI